MTYKYNFPAFIDLHVKDRISKQDADRQTRTAKAILNRLESQPGLILADEVGMGKTFVALAVATSVYLRDKKPVVIMIPSNLIEKWPNDFKLFTEFCITDPSKRATLKCSVASKPEQFLRLLDDDESNRSAIIFLTHGALARNMNDGWIKLAIIRKALFRRWDTDDLYNRLTKYSGRLLEMLHVENKNRTVGNTIWPSLLKSDVGKWKKILVNYGFVHGDFDDPVPAIFQDELSRVGTTELDYLYKQLREKMPSRDSELLQKHLSDVRQILNDESRKIWMKCMKKIVLNLPLLIFDEAHHLKNSQTQLVTKLFYDPIAEEDAGFLTGQFDRMLFLTATPFQLGHHELYRILQRFSTINWGNGSAPQINKIDFEQELITLLKQLDESQIAARRLDNSWGKLSVDDLQIGDTSYIDTTEWWNQLQKSDISLTPNSIKVIDDFQLTKTKLRQAKKLLGKYIIRHLKPRVLSGKFSGISRRVKLPGNSILGIPKGNLTTEHGLDITSEAMLPFLLAARLTTLQQDKRPVFAEGLASSYEAFRFTREESLKKKPGFFTDTDDDKDEMTVSVEGVDLWYLDQLDKSLFTVKGKGNSHPKIKPTVDMAIELWKQGEKVLIFCHYIATGKALRKYLSEAMEDYVLEKGAKLLKCNEDEVINKFENLAIRITDKDSKLGKKCVKYLFKLFKPFPDIEAQRDDIVDAILRYMRTPSFLIRFASSINEVIDEAWLKRSFKKPDNSGITFQQMISNFIGFLNNHKEDRDKYIEALKSIQPGGIRVRDVALAYADDEKVETRSDIIMANIRLCYGATKQETRQKLMKTFNTPFFPDILITSSVMAEGVDLHLNCRHIIHHDLCWNPSTLEQRTGRIDRIGAKVETSGNPIQVYLPYISETQDEKMYRVVTEREKWFNIVMGDKYKVDALSTDKYAGRLPFPVIAADELAFKLGV